MRCGCFHANLISTGHLQAASGMSVGCDIIALSWKMLSIVHGKYKPDSFQPSPRKRKGPQGRKRTGKKKKGEGKRAETESCGDSIAHLASWKNSACARASIGPMKREPKIRLESSQVTSHRLESSHLRVTSHPQNQLTTTSPELTHRLKALCNCKAKRRRCRVSILAALKTLA